MKKNKRVIALVLAAVTAFAGTMVMPNESKAAGSSIEVKTKIEYEKTDYATYADAWGNQEKIPTKDGYLFGGWYEDAKGATPITEKSQVSDKDVYAKFVPAQLMSVKAQNHANTAYTDADDKTSIRMVSSVDCRSYEAVGFEVIDIERDKLITDAPIDKVYEKLQVKENGGTKDYVASDIFGTVENAKEQNFIVLRIKNIPEAKWNSDIYVRPYWVTYDGVKVYGLGRYVYINDGIEGWVSIPVNLKTATDVAGGMISITVPTSEDYKLTYKECRVGRVFTEITANKNGNVIKCVGNTADGKNVAADDLFAVFRFKLTGTYEVGNGEFLNFTVKDLGFANNAENLVDMNIMNVQY